MTTDAPIVDADARLRALDPQTSFIVQAPAGSGKTALLTRRVLTLLASVDQPEEILSITFTRKAAAEMRDRVIETLHFALAGVEPDSAFEKEGYRLARTVLERDRQLEWNLLDYPDRLRMSTIDSLCATLAQKLPVTSTLGGVAHPVDNAMPLYKAAARSQLKHRTEHYRRLLLTLNNRFDNAEQLLGEMLLRRDQWLPYVSLFADDNRSDLRDLLQCQLMMLVEREMCQFERIIKDGAVDHLIRTSLLPSIKEATFNLRALGSLKPDEHKARKPFVDLDEMPALRAENLSVWQALLRCVLTRDQKGVRKKVDKNTGFPSIAADAKAIGMTVEGAKERKQEIVALFKALAEAPGVEAGIRQLVALPQPEYAEHQWELLDELTANMPPLVDALHKEFARRGSVDFAEIALRAQTALGEEDEPTDLALAMDLRLKHILVDEFQDTSFSQFALFKKLVAGWEKGDGRTFFAVGDPMQSIYLFRGAEVSLFGQAQSFGISDDVSLEPLTLSVNFRSSPDVVEWVNEQFEQIFVSPDEEDLPVGAITYSSSVANKSVVGHVAVHPLLDADADTAADHVAELVRERLDSDEFRAGDDHRVAILVRSKAAATPIIKALHSRNIHNLSIDMDSLGDQPVVTDLVSLTFALRFPHSRLHWLAVLRAPWCGLGLEDLHCLMADAPAQQSVVSLLSDEQRIEGLSGTGRARVRRLLEIMQPAIDQAVRGSLVSWVESVWLQLGGPVLCTKPVDKDAAERCLGVLYELEAQGSLWDQRLVEAEMQRLYAISPDDGTAKVHIMTMHKSKGLEFDTVILPGLNRAPRSSEKRLLDWALVNTENAEQRLLVLAPVTERNASGADRSVGLLVSRFKKASDSQESRRLLYVACTRAVRQLHLVAPVKVTQKGISPASGSLLEPLWPGVVGEFEQALAEFEVAGAAEADSERTPSQSPVDPPGLVRHKEGWQTPQLPVYVSESAPQTGQSVAPQNVDYLWAGREARAVGTVVHRQLERFHRTGLPSDSGLDALTPVIRRQLQREGMSEKQCHDLTPVAVDALRHVASDDWGRWLFDPSHEDARSEWALTHCENGQLENRVIDRTFIDAEGTRWIVDFKTGNHKGGDLEGFLSNEVERYGPQLRGYAEILRNLESRPVKLALYFPLLQAFRAVPDH